MTRGASNRELAGLTGRSYGYASLSRGSSVDCGESGEAQGEAGCEGDAAAGEGCWDRRTVPAGQGEGYGCGDGGEQGCHGQDEE